MNKSTSKNKNHNDQKISIDKKYKKCTKKSMHKEKAVRS